MQIVPDAPGPWALPAAEGRFLLAADVLLHETIHQYHDEITGAVEKGYHGHGPAFRDECNRIGEVLCLPPNTVTPKRKLEALHQVVEGLKPAETDGRGSRRRNVCQLCSC